MLRTNTKKVRENVKVYIIDNVKDYLITDYGIEESNLDTFEGIACELWNIYKNEHGYSRSFGTLADFTDYAQGLALGGLFCYYYNRSALDDVATILEESDIEKAKYTEEKAESLLTYLIYREVSKIRRGF